MCQQIATECKNSMKKALICCPLICVLCEHFIIEPITLFCGHTLCESCILNEEFHPSNHCPHCLKNSSTQGENFSSVNYARQNSFSKNCFLLQLFERSEKLRSIRQTSYLCRQAHTEYVKQNYHRTIELYSTALEIHENHCAFYGRAKAFMALKQPEKALVDIERVIELKPQWPKGHFYRSAILAEMKQSLAALVSSLQGLALDPDDPTGKQITASRLQALIAENEQSERKATTTTAEDDDDDEDIESMDCEDSPDLPALIQEVMADKPTVSPPHSLASSASSSASSSSSSVAITTADSSDNQLLVCQTAKSDLCLCSLFDRMSVNARDFDCSICANLLWFPVTTPCGHTFCRECLIRSIDNTQPQCPMCKRNLQEFFSMLLQSSVRQSEITAQMIETFFPREFEERKLLYEQENMQVASIPGTLPEDGESLIFEIPVFVCVLALPYLQCPLHVFEPRYRLMMRRAMESDSRTFGMCSYDERIENFADYGTLLYIRGLIYTPDGRSIVDTIGQRRFRIVERGEKDGYCTARVQLIRDDPIENQDEFNEIFQINRTTYDRVRGWFDQLDTQRRTLISRQLENYPICDDVTQSEPDGPSWAWIMLNLLPIEHDLQYTILTSRSFRVRLQIINDTIDFLMSRRRRHQQQRQQQEEQRQEEQHVEHQHEREQESAPAANQ